MFYSIHEKNCRGEMSAIHFHSYIILPFVKLWVTKTVPILQIYCEIPFIFPRLGSQGIYEILYFFSMRNFNIQFGLSLNRLRNRICGSGLMNRVQARLNLISLQKFWKNKFRTSKNYFKKLYLQFIIGVGWGQFFWMPVRQPIASSKGIMMPRSLHRSSS